MTRRVEKFATITGKGYRPRPMQLRRWKYPAFSFIFLYMFLALISPFFILLWGSLLPYYSPPSFQLFSKLTFENYKGIWHYPGVLLAFKNTAILGIVAASATMLLATVVSWFVVRGRFWGRRFLDILSFLPQAIPGIVIGLAVMLVYFILPIPIYGTIWIIAIAYITKYLAFGCRTMNAAHLQIHKELEEASLVCGKSWIVTFRRVIFPLLAPSFLNGCLWVLIHVYRELSIAVMLFSQKSIVLSTLIFISWDSGRLPQTCVLAVLMMIILFVFTFGGRMFLLKKFQNY